MPTRFVISCAARTGSTMLEYMLRSHPDVLMHGEVFHLARIGPLNGRWQTVEADQQLNARLWQRRVYDLHGFLQDVVWDPQGHDAVGLKFKTTEAFEEPWADVAKALADDKDVAVIHLRRRDLLAQFISHEAVLHHSAPLMSFTPVAPVEPFSIDIGKAIAYARDVRERDHRALELYAGHRSIVVFYERLDTDAILRFLGLRPLPLTAGIVRLIPDPAAAVTNYRAARRAIHRYGPDAGPVNRAIARLAPHGVRAALPRL